MQSQLFIMMIFSILGSLFLQKVSARFGDGIQVVVGTMREVKGRLSIHIEGRSGLAGQHWLLTLITLLQKGDVGNGTKRRVSWMLDANRFVKNHFSSLNRKS